MASHIASILGLTVWLGACASLGSSNGAPPKEAAVMAAALEHFGARNEGILRVDPRPLREDARLTGVHADDFDPDGDGAARVRRRFLRERGIQEADAAEAMRCVFSRGLMPSDSLSRPDPDSIRELRAACRSGPTNTTFVFTRALPIHGDQATHFGAGAVRVRAWRLTLWSFEVWDLTIGPRPAGWAVVDARRLLGVAS